MKTVWQWSSPKTILTGLVLVGAGVLIALDKLHANEAGAWVALVIGALGLESKTSE